MRSKPLPTQERLKELFEYDEERGALIRKTSRGGSKAGTVAGTIRKDGRLETTIDRVTYLVNRLMWMFHYGEDPSEMIVDHRNEDCSDDRIENLRLATNGQNLINVSKTKGYCWDKVNKKYMAKIQINGITKFIGRYLTEAEARAAYVEKARKVFGEFAPAC